MSDFICIEGLKVDTVIGCFAWERQILQPLLIDLKIFTDLAPAAQSDDLNDTLNYAQICEIVANTIQSKQAKLIEYAAQCAIDALFAEFQNIEKITIHIRKPAIIANTQSVGICLERTRT